MINIVIATICSAIILLFFTLYADFPLYDERNEFVYDLFESLIYALLILLAALILFNKIIP